MKRYTSRRGASLTCFLVAFGMVLTAGSARLPSLSSTIRATAIGLKDLVGRAP